MELKELIERAEKATGSQKKLALIIGQDAGNLRGAKAGLKGLPDHVCVRLAELIGVEPMTVIAASKLVTEKKEEVRKIWHPFVNRAASVILGTVILNMTPHPAEAAQTQAQAIDSNVYYVKYQARPQKSGNVVCSSSKCFSQNRFSAARFAGLTM